MPQNGWRLTRRSLLEMSWRGLLVAGVAQAGRVFAFVQPAKRRLENATADSFTQYVGTTIKFLSPAAGRSIISPIAELKLRSISRHENTARIEARIPATCGTRKRESFSLLFELQGREPLERGLHEFVQGEFKGCPVLLSRVLSAGNNRPFRYEAVFG